MGGKFISVRLTENIWSITQINNKPTCQIKLEKETNWVTNCRRLSERLTEAFSKEVFLWCMLLQCFSKQTRGIRAITAEKRTWNLALFTLCSSLSEHSCCKASGEEKGLSPGSWRMPSYLDSEQQGVVHIWDCWWTSIPASATGFCWP